ncbi:MAG: TM2 domain-containing protein [Planctomycetes bacterium]|nr:TM2 domain-containing protein [Planctomycetota bacterium]
MEIAFACSTCGAYLGAPDYAAGREVKCPQCGARMLAPNGKPDPTVVDKPTALRAEHDGAPEARPSAADAPTKFCVECGKKVRVRAEICPHCGVRQPLDMRAGNPDVKQFADKRLIAGICGILLGSLGVHKFILGLSKPGLTMLLVTICTAGAGLMVMWPIGLVEGIIYLTKNDAEFYQLYAVDKKGWF